MKFNYSFENKIPNFIERRNLGDIFIPYELMKIKELTINEKFYLAAYLVYDKSITKADDYMSNLVTKVSICKIKKHLIELDYLDYKDIKVESIDEAKKLTIKNSHKGLICEWCNNECYVLQEHHYPISKKKRRHKYS